MAVVIPRELGWWSTRPGGAVWLRALPELVGDCARIWALELGAPFHPASVAWVAPVTRADGTRAVLKVNCPHPEAEHEGDALEFWDGAGAARLLAQDRERGALLLERCMPGRQLWDIPGEDEAYAIAAGVFGTLWRPAPAHDPFRTVAGEAECWARLLAERWERHGRPWPRALQDEAVALCAELAADPPELVLCHQDAHGANMLQRGDDWVVIDPKPLVGERAFDLASSLRDRREWLASQPEPRRIVARRLDRFVSELGVDRARARGWGIVHALAWGTDETDVFSDNVACAQLIAAL